MIFSNFARASGGSPASGGPPGPGPPAGCACEASGNANIATAAKAMIRRFIVQGVGRIAGNCTDEGRADEAR